MQWRNNNPNSASQVRAKSYSIITITTICILFFTALQKPELPISPQMFPKLIFLTQQITWGRCGTDEKTVYLFLQPVTKHSLNIQSKKLPWKCIALRSSIYVAIVALENFHFDFNHFNIIIFYKSTDAAIIGSSCLTT